jgi:hypothetical protein
VGRSRSGSAALDEVPTRRQLTSLPGDAAQRGFGASGCENGHSAKDEKNQKHDLKSLWGKNLAKWCFDGHCGRKTVCAGG